MSGVHLHRSSRSTQLAPVARGAGAVSISAHGARSVSISAQRDHARVSAIAQSDPTQGACDDTTSALPRRPTAAGSRFHRYPEAKIACARSRANNDLPEHNLEAAPMLIARTELVLGTDRSRSGSNGRPISKPRRCSWPAQSSCSAPTDRALDLTEGRSRSRAAVLMPRAAFVLRAGRSRSGSNGISISTEARSLEAAPMLMARTALVLADRSRSGSNDPISKPRRCSCAAQRSCFAPTGRALDLTQVATRRRAPSASPAAPALRPC
jgi:hypothetical protein